MRLPNSGGEFLRRLELSLRQWLPHLVMSQCRLSSSLSVSGILRQLETPPGDQEGSRTAKRTVELVILSGQGEGRSFAIHVKKNGAVEASIDGYFEGVVVRCHINLPPRPKILTNAMTSSREEVIGTAPLAEGQDLHALITSNYRALNEDRKSLTKIVISLMSLIFKTHDLLNLQRSQLVSALTGEESNNARSLTRPPLLCSGQAGPRRQMVTIGSGASTAPMSRVILIPSRGKITFTGAVEVKESMKRLWGEIAPLLKSRRQAVTEFCHLYFPDYRGESPPLDISSFSLQSSKNLLLVYNALNLMILTSRGKCHERYIMRNMAMLGLDNLSCDIYFMAAPDVYFTNLKTTRLVQKPAAPAEGDDENSSTRPLFAEAGTEARQLITISLSEYCLDHDGGLVKCMFFEEPELVEQCPSSLLYYPSANAQPLCEEETAMVNRIKLSLVFMSLSLCQTITHFRGLITSKRIVSFLEETTGVKVGGQLEDGLILLTARETHTFCQQAAILWHGALKSSSSGSGTQ